MGPGRLELPTSRLSGVRSNQLSYEPFTDLLFIIFNLPMNRQKPDETSKTLKSQNSKYSIVNSQLKRLVGHNYILKKEQ